MNIKSIRRKLRAGDGLVMDAIRFLGLRLPGSQLGLCGQLAEEEMEGVLALAEVLYPPADARERERLREIVRSWASLRTEVDGYLGAYRDGIRLLDSRARRPYGGQSFREIPTPRRDMVLRALVPYGRSYSLDDTSGALDVVAAVLRRVVYSRRWHLEQYLVRDLLYCIYDSVLGWQLWAYSSWPGVVGDPLEYTRPPQRELKVTSQVQHGR